MALRRIKKELEEISKDPEARFTVAPVKENLLSLNVSLKGPSDSPYENGVFKLNIVITNDYPFKAPSVNFDTKIYHPNIGAGGNICLDILNSNWSPALSISSILYSISSLLTDPNPDSPLRSEIAKVLKEDKSKYLNEAKSWTEKYAKSE